MYVVSTILFLLPCSLLGAAWNSALKGAQGLEHPTWRRYCTIFGLTMGTIATPATIAFVFSWFHNGGSPHGLEPAPGVWEILRPIVRYGVYATALLSVLGEGKARLLLLGSAAANLFVVFMVFMLEME